jgi:hypothetical protein
VDDAFEATTNRNSLIASLQQAEAPAATVTPAVQPEPPVPPPPPPPPGWPNYPYGQHVQPSAYASQTVPRTPPPEVVLVGIALFIAAAFLLYLPLRYGAPVLPHLFSSEEFERALSAIVLYLYLLFAAAGVALIALAIGLFRGRKVSQYLTCLLCAIIAVSEIAAMQNNQGAFRGAQWDGVVVTLICIAIAALVAALPGARHYFAADGAGPLGVVIAAVIGVCLGTCLLLNGLLLVVLGTVESKFVAWGLLTLVLGGAMIGVNGPLRSGSNGARIAVSAGYVAYVIVAFVVGNEMGSTTSFVTLVPLGLALSALTGLWLPASSTAHFAVPSGGGIPPLPPLPPESRE